MVTLALLLFKLPEFDHVVEYMRALFGNTHITNLQPIILFFTLLFSIPVVGYHLLYLWNQKPRAAMTGLRPLLYGIMLFLILVNAGGGASFIYFQF